jgi:hypothetical protein
MTTQSKAELPTWIVFWERDDQYAVTLGADHEKEICAQRTPAMSEREAILNVLGGKATMQDDWRVWAVPAEEIRPRPFTVNAVTNYVDVLGEPFIR